MMKYDYERNFERINDWIKNADTKARILFSIEALFLAFFGAFFEASSLEFSSMNLSSTVFIVVGLELLAISLINSLCSLGANLGKMAGASLIYFGDLALKTPEQIRSELKDYDYENDLVNQISINAKIAKKKYISFNWALTLFLVGVMLVLFGLYLNS